MSTFPSQQPISTTGRLSPFKRQESVQELLNNPIQLRQGVTPDRTSKTHPGALSIRGKVGLDDVAIARGFPYYPNHKIHYTHVPQDVVANNPSEWYSINTKDATGPYRHTVPLRDSELVPVSGYTDGRLHTAQARQLVNNWNASTQQLIDSGNAVYTPWQPTPGHRLHPYDIKELPQDQQFVPAQFRGKPSVNPADEEELKDLGGGDDDDDKYKDEEIPRHSVFSDENPYTDAPKFVPTPGFYYSPKSWESQSDGGTIATANRIDNAPVHTKVQLLRDGPDTIASQRPIYDVAKDWSNLEKGDVRMPATTSTPGQSYTSSNKEALDNLYSSGLISRKQNDGNRYTRLSDIFTFGLKGNEQLSNALSKSIGDARRDAYNATRYTGLDVDKFINRAFHLPKIHDLAIPISIGTDSKRFSPSWQREIVGSSGLYTLDSDFEADKQHPITKAYLQDGLVKVITNADESSYAPGSFTIRLSNPRATSPERRYRDDISSSNLSPDKKYDKLKVLSNRAAVNDTPENAILAVTEDSMPASTFLHEGGHAATPYISPIVIPKNIKDLKSRKYRILNEIGVDFSDEIDDLRAKGVGVDEALVKELDSIEKTLRSNPLAHEQDSLMGLALGAHDHDARPGSIRGYAGSNLPEMLRALHNAKIGMANHLAARGEHMDDVVRKTQDPEEAVRFFNSLYGPRQLQQEHDGRSYAFPADMASRGTELEMARSVGGIQPLMQYLYNVMPLGEDGQFTKDQLRAQQSYPAPTTNTIYNNPDGRNNYKDMRDRWKDRHLTPEQRIELFRNIWPQVNNTTSQDRGINKMATISPEKEEAIRQVIAATTLSMSLN